MTLPPQPPPDQAIILAEIRVGMDGLRHSVAKLERAVQGDPDAGTLSVRAAVNAVKTELDNEVDSLCDRIDKLERAAGTQAAFQQGMFSVIKWLGGSSLVALLGFIVTLVKLFGGNGGGTP